MSSEHSFLYSSLAADSAKVSLKRTRELFDRSATFVTDHHSNLTTDAQLYQASLTRRLKTQYSHPVEGNSKKKAPSSSIKSSSDALVVVSTVRDNNGDADAEEQEEAATGIGTTGGVLTKTQSGSEKIPPKPKQSGGILVVRFVSRLHFCRIDCVCWMYLFHSLSLSLCILFLVEIFLVVVVNRNSHSNVARSMATFHGPLFSLGLGSQHCL
jgi:hypothetical protein